MYDLFNPPPEVTNFRQTIVDQKDLQVIKGLRYIPNFFAPNQLKELITIINSQLWLNDIKRRVQHYGYKYDYKARSIDYKMFLGDLPSWCKDVANRLFKEGYIEDIPDQVIINEYTPGQGIANHIDCEPCFGETIISVSLCSTCIMDFINLKTKQKVEILLEPGSLVVINGEARHLWTHGIQARKSDIYNGVKFHRTTRLSMTFRKVVLRDRTI